jgi:hypothetical protein
MTFCCYLLDAYIGFLPSLIYLNLGVVLYVLSEALETAQSHVTYLAFQLPFNFTIFQTTFHCHCMMNWNCDIWIHYELRENGMHSVSHLRCKRLVATIQGELISCNCSERACHWCAKQTIFSLVPLEFPYFHFSIPLVNRVEYLKNAARMRTLRADNHGC